MLVVTLSRLGSRKPRTIIARVAILVAALMMPILTFSTFMVVREALVQRDRLIEQIRTATLAASQAVDIEVERLQAIADTLARSPMLNQRDFSDFYALAKAAVRQQEGTRIVLYEASGQAI